jgi:hypothetical protein
MPANRTAFRTELETLKEHFERESVSTVRLGHCSVLANRPVSDELVRRVVEERERPVVRITQRPQPDGSIRYSCFVGSKDRLPEFDRLAEASENCYVAISRQLCSSAQSPTPSAADAWMARAYGGDLRRDDRGLLSVGRCWVHVRESLDREAHLTWFHDYSETEYDMKTDTNMEGEPLAEFYVVNLRHDVFTASAALLDQGLKALPDQALESDVNGNREQEIFPHNALATQAVDDATSESQTALASACMGGTVSGLSATVVHSDSGSDGQVTIAANDDRPQCTEESGAARPDCQTSAITRSMTLPEWASDDDFFGPASMAEGALAMEISISTLERQILTSKRPMNDKSIIRKGAGRGPFFFLAVDQIRHRAAQARFVQKKQRDVRFAR